MAKEEDEEKTFVSEKITRNRIIGRDGRQQISTDLVTRDYEQGDCDYTETEAEHLEGSDALLSVLRECSDQRSRAA